MGAYENIVKDQKRHNIVPPLSVQADFYATCAACLREIERVYKGGTQREANEGAWEDGSLSYYHERCFNGR